MVATDSALPRFTSATLSPGPTPAPVRAEQACLIWVSRCRYVYCLSSTTNATRSGTLSRAASLACPTFIADSVPAPGSRPLESGRCPAVGWASIDQPVGSGVKGVKGTQQVPWALPWEVSWHSGEGGTLFLSFTILYSVGP